MEKNLYSLMSEKFIQMMDESMKSYWSLTPEDRKMIVRTIVENWNCLLGNRLRLQWLFRFDKRFPNANGNIAIEKQEDETIIYCRNHELTEFFIKEVLKLNIRDNDNIIMLSFGGMKNLFNANTYQLTPVGINNRLELMLVERMSRFNALTSSRWEEVKSLITDNFELFLKGEIIFSQATDPTTTFSVIKGDEIVRVSCEKPLHKAIIWYFQNVLKINTSYAMQIMRSVVKTDDLDDEFDEVSISPSKKQKLDLFKLVADNAWSTPLL